MIEIKGNCSNEPFQSTVQYLRKNKVLRHSAKSENFQNLRVG
jgi:hypothetical protein